MQQATKIEELLRVPSPAPAPQALTCDGENLWISSWESQRLYGLDRTHFTVFEETNAPGKPVSAVSVGDELRFVLGEGDDDDRFIRRYVPGHGFKEKDRLACPGGTGSFLAYDGECLWLSQRYNKRILELDLQGNIASEIPAEAEIIGITWHDGTLYASLWYGARAGGCHIGRVSVDRNRIDPIAAVPFAAISLSHDGTRFWTNDTKANEIVAFTLD